MERTRVVVYGGSLNMAGIAASLKADAGMEIFHIDPRSQDARSRLNEIDPAVIAFDLSDPSIGLDISLWRDRPGLLLIGVDPSNDSLLLLSSHTSEALCMADLIQVIKRKGQQAM